ncbi:Ger(x)C family spore germination protein [Paenibacillus sp. sgz500958]|uniref:Ger(x)C family spore germination protein n=1 Tax=Paenibacillus sp. sgz500958 TaxID=3242475 RepID=UPI0036D32CB5
MLIQVFLLTSCMGYRDLDKMVFVTSILIDKDEDDQLVFYFETLNSTRSSTKEANKEQRIVYKIITENAGDALNRLETHTSSPVTLSHNKVILFTEKFARSGIDQAFELFDRWQESNKRTLVGVFLGKTECFVTPSHQEESITGLYLYEMLGSKESVTSYGVKINIKEFMNQKYIGDKVNSVPLLNVSKDKEAQKQYYVDGLGLIKEYTLIGTVDSDHTIFFNFLLDNAVSGNINTVNPNDETKTVSVMLKSNSFDSKLDYRNERLKVTITLKLNTDLSAVQGRLKLNEENIKKLERSLAEKVEDNCLELFQEWKDKKTDIFDIQEKFERKYPRVHNDNIIEDTDLEMNVEMEISGTTTVRDAE